MADTITGTVGGSVSANRTYASGIFNGQTVGWQDTVSAAFRTSGVTADSVDLAYVKRHTINTNSSVTINLSSATGDDGAVSNFVRVRAVCVRNRSTTDTNKVSVDNTVSNPFTGFLAANSTAYVYPSTATSQNTIQNSGFTSFTAPGTTGATVNSGVNLKIANGTNANIDVDVVILGCSA